MDPARGATAHAGRRHLEQARSQTYADVRSDVNFEPVTGSTPKQREVLLEQVKAHVTAELASRQRNRG